MGYYLLTGTDVFRGTSAVEVCALHLASEPESLSQRLGQPVPPDPEALILQCLAKDPSARPKTAQELSERLRACRNVSGWTDKDAREWWDENGPAVRTSPGKEDGGQSTTFVRRRLDGLYPRPEGRSGRSGRSAWGSREFPLARSPDRRAY